MPGLCVLGKGGGQWKGSTRTRGGVGTADVCKFHPFSQRLEFVCLQKDVSLCNVSSKLEYFLTKNVWWIVLGSWKKIILRPIFVNTTIYVKN